MRIGLAPLAALLAKKVTFATATVPPLLASPPPLPLVLPFATVRLRRLKATPELTENTRKV